MVPYDYQSPPNWVIFAAVACLALPASAVFGLVALKVYAVLERRRCSRARFFVKR